ncbi:MAG: helix-turn-helix transcriptional regulator, partial [Tidjanibacter sp.]|nr:helix-turn-helix transcriptional regulator [Tidjanibacter sp.]
MVGKKIKELAEREKMTATKLASLLGVTRPAVSAIYEKEDVSTAIVKQCAKIFGVPISYFFDEIKDVIPTSRQYTSHINIAKLNKIIESSDLTKTQIADKCNISRTTLDNVLYGADAKLSTIERITEVIGISVADL